MKTQPKNRDLKRARKLSQMAKRYAMPAKKLRQLMSEAHSRIIVSLITVQEVR